VNTQQHTNTHTGALIRRCTIIVVVIKIQ